MRLDVVRPYSVVLFSAGDLATGAVGHDPLDGVTYYFGALGQLADATSVDDDTGIPFPMLTSGIVRGAGYMIRVAGTLGTTENVAFSVRVNNTSDISLGNAVFDAATKVGTWSIAGTAVSAGDKLKIKFVAPTWATNPTDVFYFVWVWIEPTS